MKIPLYTIGHGNRSIESFLTLLKYYAIDFLIDIHSQPYSRYSSHFSRAPLEASLAQCGLHYVFMGDSLGGRPSDHGSHQSADTSLDVGQVWDMEFHPPSSLTPPHVEDVCVTHENFVGRQKDLRATLLPRIKIWEGGPESLFDGQIVIGETTAYIDGDKGLPLCSTGYWLSDRVLTLVYRRGGKAYYWLHLSTSAPQKKLYIRYVGFTVPIVRIPAKTLIRVSFARWWVPADANDERCSLQISGWYK